MSAQELGKFGFSHLLELATFAPSGYESTMLIDSLHNGAQGALEVQILAHRSYAKVLQISAYALAFSQPITLTFFHPKPYIKRLFALDSVVFVQGVLRDEGGRLSMIQPKTIREINAIIPKFKTTHKNADMISLTQSLITQEALQECGLPSDVASSLVRIFHPDKEFFRIFCVRKGFDENTLYALKFCEIYCHLLRLSTKRTDYAAKYRCTGDYQSWVESLPFTLTNAQQRVCAQIASDLASHKAAKRLVMGDVGCGKTMVILASVMMAYPKKSLLMAPTSVLAKQLYEQALLYLPKSLNITYISAESKQDLQGLFASQVDFIIGTQALLYREISGEEIALVMSDEQHRFGVKQRHYLEKLATIDSTSKPHILQFSATPIPRTMAMLESKMIDVSIIDELPYPKDITTTIISKPSFPELLAHISAEVQAARQVAIIYPLVEESQASEYLSLKEGESFWRTRFPQVYSTSGQDKEKEKVLEEFAQNGSILLATTLIEVGISLPKLSTIVIIAPEKLGLATLHQLRGRVSRNGLKGYCYLYTHTPDSARLREFAAHLSGFDIAQIDLKYRKGGDLLDGKRQSGAQWVWADLSEDEAIFDRANALLTDKESIPKSNDSRDCGGAVGALHDF